MATVFDSHADISLTENYIKQLHAMLLRHSTKDEWHRGEYKKLPNNVEAFDPDGKCVGVIFQTASPFDATAHRQDAVERVSQARAAASTGAEGLGMGCHSGRERRVGKLALYF